MKNNFEEPKMEIVRILLTDIICDSGGGMNDESGMAPDNPDNPLDNSIHSLLSAN